MRHLESIADLKMYLHSLPYTYLRTTMGVDKKNWFNNLISQSGRKMKKILKTFVIVEGSYWSNKNTLFSSLWTNLSSEFEYTNRYSEEPEIPADIDQLQWNSSRICPYPLALIGLSHPFIFYSSRSAGKIMTIYSPNVSTF